MQRKKLIRTLALILALTTVMSVSAFASVMGEYLTGYSVSQGQGMTLARGIFWIGSDYRNENYIEYTPNSDVQPVVVYGSKVTNYGSFSSMANLLESKGYHVVAGINGDYYNMTTYDPNGILIYEGKLMSSDNGMSGLGFKADGTAVMSRPYMKSAVNIAGTDYTISKINKVRDGANFDLFTPDYAPTTKSGTAGWDIICTPSADSLSLNCTVTLTVDEVQENKGAAAIPDGKMVLSLAGTASEDKINAVKALKAGDSLTVTISASPLWSDVQFAVGSYYKLVTNGTAETGLNRDLEPRTAVGMKADGTLIFYTVDGRQSGYSVGATMEVVAQRLIELGCVEATIMDGGGSTCMSAIYLGDSDINQVNRSSTGTQRSVSDWIMLATKQPATGTAAQLALHPFSAVMLKDAKQQFTAKAADVYGYAASVPAGLSYSAEGGIGSVDQNGLFTAETAGSGSVSVSGGGLTAASVSVRVADTPDTITVKNGSKTVSGLNMKVGETADLSASAYLNHVKLIASDDCFTWSVTGSAGTIDANGLFTASQSAGEGTISVTAGGKTVSIPVTVRQNGSFDDVFTTDWYYEAAEYVNSAGLITGTADRVFSPSANVSRAMMATILWSAAGKPSASSEGFKDVDSGAWYAQAVAWAQSEGIAAGYADGCFRPAQSISREQMAGMLYKYESVKNGAPAAAGDLSGYADAASVSPWAQPAVSWCISRGVISGMTANTIEPNGTATRAQCAVIMQKYITGT
jgi:exopolysaccharide biosynthesis protein